MFVSYFVILETKSREKLKWKICFFSNKIEERKNSLRKLWQQLKDLGYKNKKSESSNFGLGIDDQNCHDQTQ